MRLFIAHYAVPEKQGGSFGQELMQVNARVAALVCDEESIEMEIFG